MKGGSFHINTHGASDIRCSSTRGKGKRRTKNENGEGYMVKRNVPRTALKEACSQAEKWKLNNHIKHRKFQRNQQPSAIYFSSWWPWKVVQLIISDFENPNVFYLKFHKHSGLTRQMRQHWVKMGKIEKNKGEGDGSKITANQLFQISFNEIVVEPQE